MLCRDFSPTIAATWRARSSQIPNDPQAQGWRNELGIISLAPQSVADERIDASGMRVIAGLRLSVHLESPAVTAGDVWVLDPRTEVLAAGGLALFLCPFWIRRALRAGRLRWRIFHALGSRLLCQGHGAPGDKGFEAYRVAFGNLLACAATPAKQNGECVDGWVHDAGTLIADVDPKRVRKMMDYYVENLLRGKAERVERLCAAG